MRTFESIFAGASSTFYPAHKLFDERERADVQTLYAFVRTADDFVDSLPQDEKGFEGFAKEAREALDGKRVENEIINAFSQLAREHSFKKEWTLAFLESMRQDVYKKDYATFEELEAYMHGSAEVVGLMMAKVLRLPENALAYAALQGKAFQLINIIRDIRADEKLGRTYIPREDLERFGITTLQGKTNEHAQAFNALVRFELERYRKVQKQAEEGYSLLPPHARKAIEQASRAYLALAEKIEKNTESAFSRKREHALEASSC